MEFINSEVEQPRLMRLLGDYVDIEEADPSPTPEEESEFQDELNKINNLESLAAQDNSIILG
jgi:hypothetical protein